MDDDPSLDETSPSRLGRRGLLGLAGAGAVGAVGGAGAGALGERARVRGPDRHDADQSGTGRPRLAATEAVASRDSLPQGLADRTPGFGHVLALDLLHDGSPGAARSAARVVLKRLSAISDDAARGVGAGPGPDAAAMGVRNAALQVTTGVGASLLAHCGLARPAALVDLPAYPADRLEEHLSDGDLLVQVGAEDPMRLAGAVQRVIGALGAQARIRWTRSGFRPTEAASVAPHTTARNLMGHRDGTANPERDSPLWRSTVTARDPGSWMDGGSYLVVRQIRIDLDRWFTHGVSQRDRVIGRSTATGAPLGGRLESDPVDLDARSSKGDPVVARRAHIRLAGTRNTAGARIFRRSWNYDAGWTAAGERDAGLIFLAWQADPRRGFLPIQRSLSDGDDALSSFTTHVGSGVFAMPSRGRDDYLGQRLLEG